MEPTTEIITISAVVSLLISAIITYVIHRLLAGDVKRIMQDLEFLKLQYQTALKEIEYGLENRRKTEIVAELFAMWIQTTKYTNPQPAQGYSGPPTNKFYKPFLPDDWKKLQQLTYECALWLPPHIFYHLSERLTHQSDAKDMKEILVEVRDILNPGIGTIDPMKIIHF